MVNVRLVFVCLNFVVGLLVIPSAAVAALITVNTLGDAGGSIAKCTLRSAITAANTDTIVDGCSAGLGSDIIEFSETGTILLTASLPDILEELNVTGPGRDSLNIAGDGSYRQFNFTTSSGESRLSNLTLSKGYNSSAGGCVRGAGDSLELADILFSNCQSDGSGGALLGNNKIVIERAWFLNNRAGLNGGAVATSNSDITVSGSTFESNTAAGPNSSGGGLYSTNGSTTVTRSTFFNNTANVSGGALSGNLTLGISHSTLVGNTADLDADNNGFGGGIYWFNGTLTITNTMVADNLNPNATARRDIAPGINLVVVTNGYNLVGETNGIAVGDFPVGNPNLNQDYVGTAAMPLDSQLQPLGDYGGPTPTLLPLPASRVVDAGACPGQTSDQRGISNSVTGLRIINNPPANASDGCDIGAAELGTDVVLKDGFEPIL